MYNLSDIKTVENILKAHGLSLSKALGQNFIINPEICPEMAEQAALSREDGVLEIGPGIGVLTQELCRRAGKVISIELDKRLPDVLSDTLKEYDNFYLHAGDALETDLKALFAEHFSGCKSIKVCANLPYYITSPVIMKLLGERADISLMVLMVQKEAGERICAEVGTRKAGALTCAVNYYARAQELFEVGKENFLPQPKVESEVIKLIPYKTPAVSVENEQFFFNTIKAAFAMRRKSAVNSLSAGLHLPKSAVGEVLEKCGFNLNVRAETFTLEDFAEISKQLLKR